MTVTLGKNIAALKAVNALDKSSNSLSAVSARLASGLRINSPSDDAASLSIIGSLKTDARVYTQGVRNISDAVSYLNVAEGALRGLSDIVMRQQELAEQAANGTYSGKQRIAMEKEANALKNEYNRIVRSTSFNGQKILDGTDDDLWIQQGYGATESLKIDIGDGFGYAAGNGNFTQTQSATVSIDLGYITAAADFNNDGNLDIISSTGYLLVGNGDGTFKAPGTMNLSSAQLMEWVNPYHMLDNGASGSAGSFMHPIDLTNDGIKDAISFDQAVNLYTADSSGNFDSRRSQQILTSIIGVIEGAAGDLNGDDILDLAMVDYDNGILYTVLGNGDGTFKASTSMSYASGLATIVLADVNGDGTTDGFLMNSVTNQVQVLIGNGNGTFKAGATMASTIVAGHLNALSADFNNDGISDLFNYFGSEYQAFVGNADTSGRRNNFQYRFELDTKFNAREALKRTSVILNKISTELGNLGAAQSRLHTSSQVLRVRAATMDAARAQIEQSDVASDAAEYTKSQILQQTGVAILAQANLQPQLALQLLRDV